MNLSELLDTISSDQPDLIHFRRLSDVLKWKRPPKRAVGRKSKYASNDDSNTTPSPFDVLEAHHTRLSGMTGGSKSTPTGRPSASAKGKAAVGKLKQRGSL